MRPAPMLVCPTSELPICPSGRPTASPEVCSSVKGYPSDSLSSPGVPARRMALASISFRIPQPTRTTSKTRCAGLAIVCIISLVVRLAAQEGDGTVELLDEDEPGEPVRQGHPREREN